MADLTSNQVCNICCIHYNAGLRCCALGSLVEGGYLFNKEVRGNKLQCFMQRRYTS